jgi:uncharacterized protein (DUF1501 family)
MRCEDFTRRDFLKLTGAGAMAASVPLSLFDIAVAGAATPLPAKTPIVVLVTLYGGNDGLNTLVPYLDSTYYSSRPGISVDQSTVLPLDDGLGFNPAMKNFQSLWNAKQLTIVRGVSYPKPDLSHFSSMAIWQTASPSTSVSTGWIGRWLDTQPLNPMLAVSVGNVMPPAFAGAKQSGSVMPPTGFKLPTGTALRQFKSLGAQTAGASPTTQNAALSIANLYQMAGTVTSELALGAPKSQNAALQNVGNTKLNPQLDAVATLINAGAPTRVWEVSIGGFDTHADEVSTQNALIGGVTDSVARFMSQIAGTKRANDVTVVIYTEFGRRVKANAALGTDHGTSNAVYIVGKSGVGGFIGDEPSLTQLDTSGNMLVTTDFRDIYGSILEDLLATPVDKIIPGWKTKLPLFASK